MPSRYPGEEPYRHGNDEYNYSTRSNSSRDFARQRRYGNDDWDKIMSQVSTPLRVNQLDPVPSRKLSPYGGSSSNEDSPIPDDKYSMHRPRDLSTPVRHALAYMDDLDLEEDYGLPLPPQPRRHRRNYDVGYGSRPLPQYKPSAYHWDDGSEQVASSSRKVTSSRRDDVSSPVNDDWGVSRTEERRRERATDYTMPVSKRLPQDGVGEEEDAILDAASYIAKRKQFAVEDDDDLQQLKHQKYQYRTRGDAVLDEEPRISRSRDDLPQAPMFMMKLRSHVIWEKMYVKFTCTIRGSPPPKVTWYHDMIPIEPMLMEPGKVKISNQYGVYTLEIFKAALEDSGTYRVSAQNHKGEISSYATLLVRRYDDGKVGYYDIKSGYNMRKPTDYPDVEKLNVPEANENGEEPSIDAIQADVSHASSKTVTFNAAEPEVVGEKKPDVTHTSQAVMYKGSGAEVAQGKFESVLELRIPAKGDTQSYVIVKENLISPIRSSGDQSGAEEPDPVIAKKGRDFDRGKVNDISQCLLDTLSDVDTKRNNDVTGDVVMEEVISKTERRKTEEIDVVS